MKRTRGSKCAWLAFLLLQLALPSWSVVADAQSLGPLPSGEIHVEAYDCEPSHPLDCRLCTFLRTAAEPSRGLPDLPFPTGDSSAPLSAIDGWSALAGSRSPLARAPPA
jgi:hypothetical protein